MTLGFVLLLLVGCASQSAEATLHLSDLEPLPTLTSDDVLPLRVAVASVISPQGNIESYQPLLDYVSKELNRPVELVQRRTYQEINDLVEGGSVDVAFVCTSAYIRGKQDFGMELLAAPQTNGEATYYALLIVPADSTTQSMADLEGKVFAFTDPMSTTGRAYPTYLVKQLGSTPDQFFAHTFFTYSHDNAIRAVADGVADGASVASLVYDHAVKHDPALGSKVRIIQRSPAYGAPPVVVSPNIRPQLRATLQDLLLHLPDTPEGQAVLATLEIDRFVLIDDSAYETVRELTVAVEALMID